MPHIHKASWEDWTPARLTSPELWYDAQDLGTISRSGSAVTAWADKSGHGRNLSQPASGQRPSSGTRTMNGFNALDFVRANTDELFTSASFVINQPFNIAVAANIDINGGSHCIISSTSLANLLMGMDLDNTNEYMVNPSVVFTGYPTTPFDNDFIYQCFFNGAGSAMHMNGSFDAFGDAGAGPTGTQVYVGSNQGGGLNLDGKLGEIVCWEGSDAAEWDLVTGYLAWHWALTGNLPGSHPYKSSKPRASAKNI